MEHKGQAATQQQNNLGVAPLSSSHVSLTYYRNASPKGVSTNKNKHSYMSNSTLSGGPKKNSTNLNLTNNHHKQNYSNGSLSGTQTKPNISLGNLDSDPASLKQQKQVQETVVKQQNTQILQENQDNGRALKWNGILNKHLSEEDKQHCQLIDDDVLILTTVLDLENQRVVKADADRTRNSDQLNRDHIELILTFYCKIQNIKYKQGLNEILAPFAYLQQKAKMDLSTAYNMFSIFVWKYMTTFFMDEDFYSLQACLQLLQLLLKYHDPELSLYIDENQVTPEMYATPWFLTYFANKLDLQTTLKLWEYIIEDDEPSNIFFFSVALLLHHRQTLLESESSNLPSILSKLTIQSTDQLQAIWKSSQEIREKTPHSFRELPDINLIFSSEFLKYPKDQQLMFLERIENLPCLPILVDELFFYSYPDILSCSHPQCMNSLNQFRVATQSIVTNIATQQSSTSNRRPSMAYHEDDILTPEVMSEYQMIGDDQSLYSQLSFTQNARRLTHAESTKSPNQYNKKANIHDIIKKEINTKQVTRQGSLQQSPLKIPSKDENYYKGIDITSQRSPFKTNNKQHQAQADGMPLETDSNVLDDAPEQQESHIDLINETAKMKHLAATEEQKQMQKRHSTQGSIQVQEPRIGNSPKAQLSQYLNQSSFGPGQQFSNKSVLSDYSGGMSTKQKQSNYARGLSSSACKLTKAHTSLKHAKPPLKSTSLKMAPQLLYCKKCEKRQGYNKEAAASINDTQNEDESHDFYYEKIRFLVVDCRLDAIQKESLLPNSFEFAIPSECNKEYLQSLSDQLISCKDVYHICLLGLQPLTQKYDKKFETNNEGSLDIGDYHERILRYLIDDFHAKGFKYVSIMPGGFSECHDLALEYNFQLLNHDQGTCYHCERAGNNKKGNNYNQEFNLVGFSDLVSGFKHWYDVAGTKLKSFVRAPIKMLGNNQSGSKDQSRSGNLGSRQQNQSIDAVTNVSKQNSDSRNQGPHKQSRHQHKTTDDQSKLPSIANTLQSDLLGTPSNLSNMSQGHNNNGNMLSVLSPHLQQDNQSDKLSELSLGSLPISFVSQSSRQEVFSQLHGGSHCSSNVSMNSSQNDGNNLRDAISNKKIMSYKLMSKVPGDRNEITQQLVMEDAMQPQEVDSLAIGSPVQERDNSDEEEKQLQSPTDFNGEPIKVELVHDSSNNQLNIRQQQKEPTLQRVATEGSQTSKKPVGVGLVADSEAECYKLNGITKQFEVNKAEFESLISKKSSIIFKAHKLQLKKKGDTNTNSQSYAYSVVILVTPFTVSVIREKSKNKEVTHLLSAMNLSVESSLSLIDEWDQADFDELHPSLKGNNPNAKNTMHQKKTQAIAMLESRFLMHDLIKITSRKSSSKIITFYFRIPLFADYKQQILEKMILSQLDQKPPIQYTFAFKRESFQEVSISFEFAKEEEAKQCITSVSQIYKKLKNSKQ